MKAFFVLLFVSTVAGQCYKTVDALNMRSSPSRNGALVTTIPGGSMVTKIGGQATADGYTWYNIKYQGWQGWSASQFLTGCTAPPVPPPPAGGGGSCSFTMEANPNFSAASTATLTKDDIVRAAQALGVEPAAVKAVADVEAGGNGFFGSTRPKILYEALQFYRLTNGRYGSCNTVSCSYWERSLYKGGEAEYDRLNQAYGLDRNAALQSASWGAFQIMGFNYRTCGYPSLESFIGDMKCGHAGHLKAFLGFVRGRNLIPALQNRDWKSFAYTYNGAGYAANQYDTKMANAYANAKANGYNTADDEMKASNSLATALMQNSVVLPVLMAVAAALVVAVVVLSLKLRRARQVLTSPEQEELL